jgi:hypothetical protein
VSVVSGFAPAGTKVPVTDILLTAKQQTSSNGLQTQAKLADNWSSGTMTSPSLRDIMLLEETTSANATAHNKSCASAKKSGSGKLSQKDRKKLFSQPIAAIDDGETSKREPVSPASASASAHRTW